jgi:hypothetical protein
MAALISGVVPPPGRVPLSDKEIPLFERELRPDESMAYTINEIDVSAFKDFLLNSPSTIWDEDYHDVNNVKLMRPAHDAWGIKKIMFTFCDDFLLKVLDLPFSQDEVWRKHLKPIYDACGVPEHRIVRSLLASMPPGVNIPVHHDTGHWVKYTHRIHVAIHTNTNDVDFFVGHKNEKGANGIQKYLFNEGRIVELNNQAKHAVTNNWDENRIHLIFDYVDDDFPLVRHILKKGEQVNQTRRSIDLASQAGTRPLPSFMILGVQKCGTTSMYENICQHPLVSKGKRRETHYFDWRWNKDVAEDNVEAHRKEYAKYYHEDLLKYPSILTGESTPSYLLHADIVIPRLLSVVPHIRKFLVMLRDPTARAYSQFQMSIDQKGSEEQLANRGHSLYAKESFHVAIKREIDELNSRGVHPGMTWLEFRNAAIIGLPLGHGGHSLVLRGLYALQLLPWLEEFGKEGIKIMSIGELKGNHIHDTMKGVFEFINLPPIKIEDTTAKNVRTASAPIDDVSQTLLREYFAPYNERLFQLLGKKIEDW